MTLTEEIEIHAARHTSERENEHVLRSGHATQFFPDGTWACADGWDCEVTSLDELEVCDTHWPCDCGTIHDPQQTCTEVRAEARAR